jgi:hypothetical protein
MTGLSPGVKCAQMSTNFNTRITSSRCSSSSREAGGLLPDRAENPIVFYIYAYLHTRFINSPHNPNNHKRKWKK